MTRQYALRSTVPNMNIHFEAQASVISEQYRACYLGRTNGAYLA